MGKVVACWSNVHGQPRTTSNMIAVATTIALEYGKRCIVAQTHFNLNNLESYLIGNREFNKDLITDSGLDGLARSIKLQPLDGETIDNYSVSLINNKLMLLPGTTSENRKVFKDDMGKTISIILKEISKHHDLVFVDLNSGEDEVSKLVLAKADIVIVNLCQNKSVLDNYVTSGLRDDKKMMYLIGSYDKESSYNLKNLKFLYKPLSMKVMSTIPYNTEFMDAQSDGSVLKFLRKNIAAKKEGSNTYFMNCVKDAAGKLMKLTCELKDGKAERISDR